MDNELKSSLLFQKRISKLSFPYIEECRGAIEATKKHKFSEDHDTNILLDGDLFNFRKNAISNTRDYAKNIRKEYQS